MENFNKYNGEKTFIFKDIDDNYLQTDKSLERLIKSIDTIFGRDNKNFADLCFYTYRLKKLFTDYSHAGRWVYSVSDVLYSFDSIMKGFGLDNSQTSRLLSCFDKFCCLSESDITKASCTIINEFAGFSRSKLFELLTIPNEQLIKDLQDKVLRPDFTIKQLRQYVKNYNALQKQQQKISNEPNEPEEQSPSDDEIPEAYNPKQHYDFYYFESKNKAQLLNIVWDLQKEYERLKNEINKK